MTDRRISRVVPGELSHDERRVVSDVVLEYDSDFRVKTGAVTNISLETPVPGVIVLNEYDGKVYYADNYGWHQQGTLWSPITLFVDFNGTDQFEFKFKAPADSADPSVLIIHDGDGTITEVDGDDDTEVTHTTNYSEAGTYYFYVLGDWLDLTRINIANQAAASGDVSGWVRLINLTSIACGASGVTGDISGWSVLTTLTSVAATKSSVYGDISGFSALINITIIFLGTTHVSGDISGWSGLNLGIVNCKLTNVTFDSINAWTVGGNVALESCKWTSTMVDNCLISLANGDTTGQTINLGGNNAARTSASDAAMEILESSANANTVTVNE